MARTWKQPGKCCAGCCWWKSLFVHGAAKCCHKYIETGERCGRVGDTCPSRMTVTRERRRTVVQVARRKEDGNGGNEEVDDLW